jgi:hypothetical protein
MLILFFPESILGGGVTWVCFPENRNGWKKKPRENKFLVKFVLKKSTMGTEHSAIAIRTPPDTHTATANVDPVTRVRQLPYALRRAVLQFLPQTYHVGEHTYFYENKLHCAPHDKNRVSLLRND